MRCLTTETERSLSMGKSNTEQLNIAKKYLGQGGSRFRKFCGLPAGAAWCDAFVTTIFAEAGNSSLFCSGKKQTYCPTTISLCRKQLAEVPPYLALPSDIIFFDWEPNGVPNHIGFVRERKDCEAIYTIEGNTSGGIVANKLRNTKYVCGIYRPHFKATYKLGKLTVDGYFGYNSIAMLQKALGVEVDGILGRGTVKALQRKCGASADGLWGKATSKAVQKFLGVTVDGYFGPNSVKALQKWINKATNSSPSVKDPLQPWYDAMKEQAEWSKDSRYNFNAHPTVANSKKEGTCITFPSVSLQRLGLLPSGRYIYLYPKTMKIAGNGADYVKKHKETFEILYPHKTIKQLGSKIHKGDIVGYGNPGYHTMVYMGMKDGRPTFNTAGNSSTKNYAKLGTFSKAYENRKVDMIVRIKKVK